MKTLRTFWEGFYSENEAKLAQNYPGINSFIFIREVGDLFVLDHPVISVSQKFVSTMAEAFQSGRPFAYLLKFSEFYGNRFYIDERVLVPRSETEMLVDRLMKFRKKRGSPFKHVLDVGVGSGVILLSLLDHGFAAKGTGSDLSLDALTVARNNARHLRLQANFIQSDRLEKITETYDVIVSNPPYIKKNAHASGVHSRVDDFEPHLALYLEDANYASWFETFFSDVFSRLESGGLFAMEGHEEELQNQSLMLQTIGFKDVKVLKDLTGRDRYLEAFKG